MPILTTSSGDRESQQVDECEMQEEKEERNAAVDLQDSPYTLPKIVFLERFDSSSGEYGEAQGNEEKEQRRGILLKIQKGKDRSPPDDLMGPAHRVAVEIAPSQ
jgi:hypothetical protein